MQIQEVFTPGRFPQWTYVDTHLKEKEQHLLDALNEGSRLISISGPSKSGKTVFVEHVIGKENLVLVTGAGVKSTTDLWVKVFDIIGTPIVRNKSSSKTTSGSISATAGGEANVLISKSKGEVKGSFAHSREEAHSDVEAVDVLQLLIRELASTEFVVLIDDFHYIDSRIQTELAHQLKEAMRKGVKFICASVPYHADDVIRSNPDLRGRIFSIDFEYWGPDVLAEIASKGFDKANVKYDKELTKRFSSEAAGSPQLMQCLCLNACYEIGLRKASEKEWYLENSDEGFVRVCRRTVMSADYSSIVDKMIEGPKTRGSDRNVYISKHDWQGDVYKFLIKALSLDPPKLTFRYQPLVDRVGSICKENAPNGSSITNACHHVAVIANDAAGDNIVEWDSSSDVFDIRDPYLLFYLRWSGVIAG